MEELLIIRDQYVKGKINLEEAIRLSQQYLDLSYDSLKKVLSDEERENVINLFEWKIEVNVIKKIERIFNGAT